MRRITSPHTVRDATEALHVSATTRQHSIERLIALEVAARRLPNVGSSTAIHGATGMQSVCTIAPLTTSLCPRLSAQGIIMITIWVIGSGYMTALKKTNFDVVGAKIQEASMICKGIKQLCADPSLLWKGGGGLRKCNICLLNFEDDHFLMPQSDRHGARKGHVYGAG